MTLNPKIQKLRAELGKNREKVSELQARNKELEKQIRELENIDIVGLVRAEGLGLEQFAELLRQARAAVPMPDDSKEEMEEAPDYEA